MEFRPTRCAGKAREVTDDDSPELVAGLARQFGRVIQRDLAGIRHVGAMRVEPQRLYPLKGTRPLDVGRRGQRATDIIFSATRRKQSRVRLMRALDGAFRDMGISTAILARVPTGANAYAILLDHLRHPGRQVVTSFASSTPSHRRATARTRVN